MELMIVLLVGGLLYFLPSLIAGGREHRNVGAIFALNLLAGWTFIGWVGALVWSVMAAPPAPPVRGENDSSQAD